MIPMKMGNKNFRDLHIAEAGFLELSLGPFPAVKQKDLTASFYRKSGNVPCHGWPATTGSQEDDTQLRHVING